MKDQPIGNPTCEQCGKEKDMTSEHNGKMTCWECFQVNKLKESENVSELTGFQIGFIIGIVKEHFKHNDVDSVAEEYRKDYEQIKEIEEIVRGARHILVVK